MFSDECTTYGERLLNPSIYKKFNVTRELIGKQIDPEEFRYRGGLDLTTYNALQERWQSQHQIMENNKKDVISQYGSLEAAPLSLGPFERIKPVTGTKNALVLLTEFKDVTHVHNTDEFEKLLFSKGSYNSMRDYYLEASWNQLDITGKINEDWYTASNNRSEYVDEAVDMNYPLARNLVKETIIKAKNSGIDFKPFANNGTIELLIVVFSGFGFDVKHDIKKYIRPHRGQLSEPFEVQSGIFADKYALIPELPLNLGCYCHEMGHLLGLPDLYNEQFGPIIGSWCIMACGDHIEDGKTPALPSAWCKVHLGWKEPVVIRKLSQNMEIPAIIDDNGVIFKIEISGDGGEYFLLENRQQKGFDRNLPGNGLLIWHIDENQCIHKAPNSDPKHLGITLEQSDGKNALQSDYSSYRLKEVTDEIRKNMMGDGGDAYPGETVNRTFDENSNPNSDSVKGVKSGANVTQITDSDDLMKAEIGLKHVINVSNGANIRNKPSNRFQVMKKLILSLLNSQKPKNPYDMGYEDAKKDLIENGLNIYQYGYMMGFLHGYEEAGKLINDEKNEILNKPK
ncbi:MAG TPA: M6 family metalloprotease domain-containing protein [Methanobacterium sp.]|nr:M6 family metalloprotease domain-containing protein [Methanobacterium sp.]